MQSKVIFLLLALIRLSHADTIVSKSASFGDVNDAVSQAQSGDTVIIPPGYAVWTNGLKVNKSIAICGAGQSGSATSTIYKSGAFTAFEISGLPGDVPVRITGLRVIAAVGQHGDNSAVAITGPQSLPGYSKIRIDHCDFVGGQLVIFWQFAAVGIVDHCNFLDPSYASEVYGCADLDWNRYSAPNPAFRLGGLDAVYYEDDSFTWDVSMPYADTMSDCFEGGRVVIRHCTFDATALRGSLSAFVVQHGNEGLWNGKIDNLRGALAIEFYDNICKIGTSYRVIWLRGGRFLVANNSFVVLSGNIGKMVVLSEEECWGSSAALGWWPLRPITAWPAEDMCNGFIWGNTINGQPADSDAAIGPWNPGDAIIQKGRDWFDKPPDATTNTYYPDCPFPSRPQYPNPFNPMPTSWSPAPYPHPLVDGEYR